MKATWGVKPDAVDLLLRWKADETVADDVGLSPVRITTAFRKKKGPLPPGLERVIMLLQHAPQDRAWRRRGTVILICRARQRILRTGKETGKPASAVSPNKTSGENGGKLARIDDGTVHDTINRADEEYVSSSDGGRSQADDSSLSGMVDWLAQPKESGVFRHIIGFL